MTAASRSASSHYGFSKLAIALALGVCWCVLPFYFSKVLYRFGGAGDGGGFLAHLFGAILRHGVFATYLGTLDLGSFLTVDPRGEFGLGRRLFLCGGFGFGSLYLDRRFANGGLVGSVLLLVRVAERAKPPLAVFFFSWVFLAFCLILSFCGSRSLIRLTMFGIYCSFTASDPFWISSKFPLPI